MALDVGDRRIGVAVSDPLGITTRPVGDVAVVMAAVREWEPARVVVGDPRLPSGDRGEQAEATDAFVTLLAPELAALGIGIERWDESYTTETALARLRARGVDARRAKALVDAEAAAVILEEWLRAMPDGGSAADVAGSPVDDEGG